MEETVKTFRDMDTESLIMRLKRNIYHRDQTMLNIDELSQKQGNLNRFVERRKMQLEMQIAGLETFREERSEEYNRRKLTKARAIAAYDDVIKAFTEELNRRGVSVNG